MSPPGLDIITNAPGFNWEYFLRSLPAKCAFRIVAQKQIANIPREAGGSLVAINLQTTINRNPYYAEICLLKPWRLKGLYKF